MAIPDVLRKAGFALVAWLATIVIVARYFHVHLGRNLTGILTGTGMLVSVSVVNLSAFGLQSSLFSIIRYVGPVWVLLVYFLWIYTLWYYGPPVVAGPLETLPLTPAGKAWTQQWQGLTQTLRKVFKP